ncbi:MAG: hypothetical protein QM765_19745 [Myxococcales bacterium]
MVSTPLFTQHSRLWRENRFVYPVISRRSRGLSIGINLSPGKQCTFRCVYCSVDRSVPGPEGPVDLDVVTRELDTLLGQVQSGELWADGPLAATPLELRRLNDIAFSGDGEPTATGEFPRAAEVVAQALQKRGMAPKIVVITNATLLDKPQVKRTLAFLDDHHLEVWAKLDAGTEGHYREIDRSGVPLEKVLANLLATAQVRPVVIQSMFARLHGAAPAPAEIEAWLGRLKDLVAAGGKIDRVQVYTSARKTAEPFVQPLSGAELEAIADGVRRIGLRAETFA